MDLHGIIAISGKGGLFKVVGQNKNTVIVESIIDGKKFPAFSTNKISALEDISIYTDEGDELLSDVFRSIYNKEKGGIAPSHKEEASALRDYLKGILPNYDEERVYTSDVKKLFQWYNILHGSKNLNLKEEGDEENKEKKTEAKKGKKEVKKTSPKALGNKKPVSKKPTGAKNITKKSTGAKKGA